MANTRKKVSTLRRTYITTKVGRYGFRYLTRMIDARSGKDIRRNDEDLTVALSELDQSLLPKEPEKAQSASPKKPKKAQSGGHRKR